MTIDRSGTLALLFALAAPQSLAGESQDHFVLPPEDIERRLADEPFQIGAMVDNRWEGDRTQRALLRFQDGVTLPVKWARSAEGGFDLNNQPRYELAAYRLQALFLDRGEWVVPPTVLRVMPLRVYRQLDPELGPTFQGTHSVLVVLQYWLDDVEALERPDTARLRDIAYARRLAQLNTLTYLIRHSDSNIGNVLIGEGTDPRMFAVDNGVSFGSPPSPRGTVWRDLHVRRMPSSLVRRLRSIDREALDRSLSVVAQLRVTADGSLERTDAAPKRNPHLGVDYKDNVVQLGLTESELDDLWTRLQQLLRRVDAGDITTF